MQTSTSLLDNLTQSIPEEEGEQNAEEEEDKTTESETAPLNPSGSQLFAHFNSNVSVNSQDDYLSRIKFRFTLCRVVNIQFAFAWYARKSLAHISNQLETHLKLN